MRQVLDDPEPLLERYQRRDGVGQFQVGQRQIDEALRLPHIDALGLNVVRPESVPLHEEDDARRRNLAAGLGSQRIDERLQDHCAGPERAALERRSAVEVVGGNHV
ncbi:MAG: hypothetical protein U0791_24375 [Gemmataceae bacterium]